MKGVQNVGQSLTKAERILKKLTSAVNVTRTEGNFGARSNAARGLKYQPICRLVDLPGLHEIAVA